MSLPGPGSSPQRWTTRRSGRWRTERAIPGAGGPDFSDVVRTRIYETDFQDFHAVNSTCQDSFKTWPREKALVQVAGCPGAKVGIEMIGKI
ncbi:MAG: RidA family protein [Methanolinea sp.]|nr:RidA family protein [Methanolinea sp.]